MKFLTYINVDVTEIEFIYENSLLFGYSVWATDYAWFAGQDVSSETFRYLVEALVLNSGHNLDLYG